VASPRRRAPERIDACRLGLARVRFPPTCAVACEDCLVEFVEFGARLDTELLDEDVAGVAVGLECIGLAAAAVEREHQVSTQPLAPRVPLGQLLELSDQFGVAPGGKVGLDAHLDGGEVLLF
jgi:hypothetical protein